MLKIAHTNKRKAARGAGKGKKAKVVRSETVKEAKKENADGGTAVKNDVKGRAAALVRSSCTQAELFPDLGLPLPLTFEDATKGEHDRAGTRVKAKDLPGWCHLQSNPQFGKLGQPIKPKLYFCISHDGKSVNTRLLNKKLRVMTTLRAFGKPLQWEVHDETIAKCAALYATAPPLNGNGCIVRP